MVFFSERQMNNIPFISLIDSPPLILLGHLLLLSYSVIVLLFPCERYDCLIHCGKPHDALLFLSSWSRLDESCNVIDSG